MTLRLATICTTLFLVSTLGVGCAASDDPALALDEAALYEDYDTLTFEDQVAVWEALLEQTLVDDDLTPAERRFIQGTLSDLDVVMRDPEAFGARAIAVFGEARAQEIFGEARRPASGPTAEEAGRFVVPTCDSRWMCGGCQCNGTHGMACLHWACRHDCVETSSGCGWFWTQSCTGFRYIDGPCSN